MSAPPHIRNGRPRIGDLAGEAAALARIAALRSEGLGARNIARELDREGIATRHGGPWSPSVVGRVINRAEDEKLHNELRERFAEFGRARSPRPSPDEGAAAVLARLVDTCPREVLQDLADHFGEALYQALRRHLNSRNDEGPAPIR